MTLALACLLYIFPVKKGKSNLQIKACRAPAQYLGHLLRLLETFNPARLLETFTPARF